jgi:phosphate transport system protein
MTENRVSFHHELDDIRRGIVRLAAMVTEAIPRGTEVLLAGDLQAARQLIEDDDAVDALALQVEEHCYGVLALQQPMAGDLRAIVTAIRLVTETERSADLVVNIAKGARRLYGTTFEPRVRGLIEQMSEESVRLFRLAIDAYAEGNAGLAAALDDIDDRLDDLHSDYIQAIFLSHHGGNLTVESGVQLALIGRYYERIGDHAVNIGNRVQYMVTGWLPEHSGAARAVARAERSGTGDGLLLPDGSPAHDHLAADVTEVIEDGAARPELHLASTPDEDGGR